MNKNKIDISEHLLAKFLDGKTDARETEQVLAYLNESKENLEEFMNIRSAILSNADCPVEIDLAESLDVVKQHITTSHTNKKRFQKRFYLITSFAAAAMVAGFVFLFAFFNLKNDTSATAQAEPPTEEIEVVIQDTLSESVSPVNHMEVYKNMANNDERRNNKSVEFQEEETEVEVQIMERNTAARTVGNQFEMLKPAKTPYVVSVKNLSKTFDFQYNTNAEKVEVVLKDRSGKVLLAKEISQTGLQLKYEDYYKHIEIYWELRATFQDGAVEEKQGILQLMIE